MRKIKINAYDKEECTMLDAMDLSFLMTLDPVPKSQMDNFILLQYSGRKDKNNTEIYLDSDIFKFKYMNSPTEHIDLIGVMTFNDEDLRVEIDIYPETDGYVCLSYIGNGQMYDFEIIGTMQENPELLKE